MISGRISLYTGGRIVRPLSIHELLSCWDVQEDTGCTNGGVPERAYEYIIRNGVSTDADHPHDQTESTVITPCNETRLNGTISFLSTTRIGAIGLRRSVQIQGGYRPVLRCGERKHPQYEERDIHINGPIVGTIMVHDNLYYFGGMEVYSGADGTDFVGGHACIIIWWCDEGINGEEPGFDSAYWICKNSLSLTWPTNSPASKGYFYVEMGRNVVGIESRASRALPVITDEITANKVESLDEVRYTSYTYGLRERPRTRKIFIQGRRDPRVVGISVYYLYDSAIPMLDNNVVQRPTPGSLSTYSSYGISVYSFRPVFLRLLLSI